MRKYSEEARLTIDDPRIEPCPMTGCWLWTRSLDHGYGRVRIDGVDRSAHRAVWEKANGTIPEGMYLDHACRERSCVNPDHMRVVTPRENAIFNSIGTSAQNHAKALCPRCGSAFTVVGVRMRRCRPCDRAWSRKRRKERVATEPGYAAMLARKRRYYSDRALGRGKDA